MVDQDQSERSAQAKLMAEKRAAERDISIPPIVNPARRAAAEADVFVWLTTYLPHRFFNPWTEVQMRIVNGILAGAQNGGDKAIADSRGGGKTSIAEGVVMFCLVKGILKFPVIVSATGPEASRVLSNIKYEFEFNDILAEDYPEVCVPIRSLEGAPQRAKMQTVKGVRTSLEWSADMAVFPTIEGSKISGSVLMTRGLDAAIRGMRYRSLRPDFVLIDDPETRESAGSSYQCTIREQTIDRDIAGLGGPGVRIARVMLCTVQNRTCLSFKFTDPKQKPGWGGERFSFLLSKPTHEDKWEQYLELIRSGQEDGSDPTGRNALDFYQANRALMDEGGQVANIHRYIKEPMADGTPAEVSALQHYYNWVNRIGRDAVATELDNNPPQEDGPERSGISADLVQSRLHRYPQGTIPNPECQLAIAIDMGMYRCHWVAACSNRDAASFIVDYDFADVRGTSPEDIDRDLEQDDPRRRMAIEQALLKTLYNLRDNWQQNPYMTEQGEIIEPGIVLIDAGSGIHMPAVYQFCKELKAPFVPSKGFGTGRGRSNFYAGKASPTRRIGDRWSKVNQPASGIWLHEFDADYWKKFVHQRFMTPTLGDDGSYRCGSLSLWKSDLSHRHAKFARQIEAEQWVEVFERGKGTKGGWEAVHKDNHFLDASAMAMVGLSMLGVRVVGEASKRTVRSMADMQRAANQGKV